MDLHAARKARRNNFKADLANAYTDEEATPPEWVDLGTAISEARTEVRTKIADETAAFIHEPDIRRAIARRERATDDLRRTIDQINRMVSRLNLIAPHQRFTQTALDPDELLRPLYRTARPTSGASGG